MVAQTNVLLLRKKDKTFKSYYVGHHITLKTVNNTYADGIITKITSDSVYIRSYDLERSGTDYGAVYIDTVFRYTTAIHYNEIGAVLVLDTKSNRKTNGTILVIAGGGVLFLGAVNGLYRGDPPKDWYKPSGFILAGVFTALGIWLRRSADKKYDIGKKYQLKILELSIR
jgi:hypothetical protein